MLNYPHRRELVNNSGHDDDDVEDQTLSSHFPFDEFAREAEIAKLRENRQVLVHDDEGEREYLIDLTKPRCNELLRSRGSRGDNL